MDGKHCHVFAAVLSRAQLCLKLKLSISWQGNRQHIFRRKKWWRVPSYVIFPENMQKGKNKVLESYQRFTIHIVEANFYCWKFKVYCSDIIFRKFNNAHRRWAHVLFFALSCFHTDSEQPTWKRDITMAQTHIKEHKGERRKWNPAWIRAIPS